MKKRHLDWSRHTFYHQMMSLTLYLCRKNTFPGQMCCIFFSVSPRDREFSKTGHKMLAKWGIRLPNQFLSHNTLLQSKNQAKVAYFTKLMILIFGCPEEIRITNFTRMPHHHHHHQEVLVSLSLPCSLFSFSPSHPPLRAVKPLSPLFPHLEKPLSPPPTTANHVPPSSSFLFFHLYFITSWPSVP